MGNCCSGQQRKGGQTLGGPATATSPSSSNGQVVGANAKEAMLKAAEERRQKAENRGVQQGGGSLSKKLNEERGKKYVPEQRSNSPEMWD
ncbi:hypothetical protein DM01DRAFT_1005129 [Hesseltinella vesiculosa]|uniref:Uncharacterized protein n=1 Tax=Hesseltinella vesiculosa TaxID=101127 RepID=A0A1X2GXG0_9FUNG|nr:hypothetical protein DM01DRAFT_1005129 [Hesseltinella vesiculosa]